MFDKLKKGYFLTPISLFIEIIVFLLFPVLVFLYIPSLLPFRTIYIVFSLGYIVLFFYKTGLPVYSSLGITKIHLLESVISSIKLSFISGILLLSIVVISPEIKALGGNVDQFNQVPHYIFIPIYMLISIPLQELIFRGFFITRIKLFTQSSTLVTILVALLFTLMHVAFGEPLILPFAFIFGVLINQLYLWHNNIFGPIIYHCAMGLVAMTLVL